MHDIGFGLLMIENASLVDLETIGFGRWKICLRTDIQSRAKLVAQVGVEHSQCTSYAGRCRESPYSKHRSAQETPPRDSLPGHFSSFGPSTMQDFILLWCDR